MAALLERCAAGPRRAAVCRRPAALLHRSVALTADPRLRADRALAAARAHLQAGNFDAALGLLAVADADAGDDLQRARGGAAQGKVTRTASSGREAPVRLLQAARRLEPLDVRLARDTYLDAWGAALVAGSLAPAEGQLLEVCRAARSAPRGTGESTAR